MLNADQPGRRCPLHYRYSPSVFRDKTDLRADVLYIAGGLYGNPFALEQLLRLFASERKPARLVFNGDFNWFNRDPSTFVNVNEQVLQHTALRGNVETELSSDETQGCGCAYPEWVSDGVVSRSNEIMAILRRTAHQFPELCAQLAALPMYLVAKVGGLRVAIVHGDAESLAGWSFAHETLSQTPNDERLKRWFETAAVSVFACTHTCLPVVKLVRLPAGEGAIVNNGSCGMPNLAGTNYGVVTRIATYPTSHPTCAQFVIQGIHVDLLRVDYDHTAWLRLFCQNWPAQSSAYVSYFKRISEGPAFVGPVVL
jgi:NAD(P)-dependent dehydrogenase (short-subunit alcohol dehydrogenase family)